MQLEGKIYNFVCQQPSCVEIASCGNSKSLLKLALFLFFFYLTWKASSNKQVNEFSVDFIEIEMKKDAFKNW